MHIVCNVPLYLYRIPIVYGIWHPYKYSIVLVYWYFFPFFVSLTNGTLKDADKVPNHRKLIYIERLVAALVLTGHTYKQSLSVMCNRMKALPRPLALHRTTMKYLYDGLSMLLFQYVLASFATRHALRDTHWCQETKGTCAHTVLKWCLHVIVHLTYGKEHIVDYVCTVCCALYVVHL